MQRHLLTALVALALTAPPTYASNCSTQLQQCLTDAQCAGEECALGCEASQQTCNTACTGQCGEGPNAISCLASCQSSCFGTWGSCMASCSWGVEQWGELCYEIHDLCEGNWGD